MDFETIISVLGLLGIGGILGSYLQNLWSQKGVTESRMQEINEEKYRSILIFMRCLLKPESLQEFNIPDKRIYDLKGNEEVKKFARSRLLEYYYHSFLYASDEVLTEMKNFIKNPNENNFVKAAFVMRRDLWKKKTKVGLDTLSLE